MKFGVTEPVGYQSFDPVRHIDLGRCTVTIDDRNKHGDVELSPGLLARDPSNVRHRATPPPLVEDRRISRTKHLARCSGHVVRPHPTCPRFRRAASTDRRMVL